mgnify:CR=1 FL=1
MRNRFLGALLGLACGDAVGTTVEFKRRGSFEPVADMVGGGPFRLNPGEWTDDTSMALCLATSLVECGIFDPADQMDRYTRWMRDGYLSSNGECFDIGLTVSRALREYCQTGNPFSGSKAPDTAGNGCLMRLAPVPMFYFYDRDAAITYSGESSRTTHGATECVEASRLFGAMLHSALAGMSKSEVLLEHGLTDFSSPTVTALACGGYAAKSENEIRSSGYVVESLEAALWCFHRTDSFRDAVLTATNLGHDADTTAAICGQLAGAFYGEQRIPGDWLSKLALAGEIRGLANTLFRRALETHYETAVIKNREAIFQEIAKIGRRGYFPERTDSASLQDTNLVNRLLDRESHRIREYAWCVSQDERVAYIKGLALLEDRHGFRGSATSLWPLLDCFSDEDRPLLKWVLENTNTYAYYAHGARSLEEFDEINRRHAAIAAEGIRRDQLRQQEDKKRIAKHATENLFNAVRRGDLKAVQRLLAKGADPSVSAPDGSSLIELAYSTGLSEIGNELLEVSRRIESPPLL